MPALAPASEGGAMKVKGTPERRRSARRSRRNELLRGFARRRRPRRRRRRRRALRRRRRRFARRRGRRGPPGRRRPASTSPSTGTRPERVVIDLTDPSSNHGDAEGDVFESIENFIGSAFGDFIRATGDRMVLFGGRRRRHPYRHRRRTFLLGGAGADRLIGRGERNSAVYWDSPIGLTVDLADPSRNTGIAAGDSYDNIDELEGTDFADRLLRDRRGQHDLRLHRRRSAGRARRRRPARRRRRRRPALRRPRHGPRGLLGRGRRSHRGSRVVAARNTGEAAGDSLLPHRGPRRLGLRRRPARRRRAPTACSAAWRRPAGRTQRRRRPVRRGRSTTASTAATAATFSTAAPGRTALYGGDGRDRAVYWDAPAGVTADLADPSAQHRRGGRRPLRSVEGLEGSAFDDLLPATSATTTCSAAHGDDRLVGRAGDDELFGQDGRRPALRRRRRRRPERRGRRATGSTAAPATTTGRSTGTPSRRRGRDLADPARNRGEAAGDVYFRDRGARRIVLRRHAARRRPRATTCSAAHGDDRLSGRGTATTICSGASARTG